MAKLPELWQNTPKAHMSVISDIRVRMTAEWTFEDIYLEVAKSDIQDDDDILATTRALRLIRDERRRYLQNA